MKHLKVFENFDNMNISNQIKESINEEKVLFNYKCKKCGSTYTNLKKKLDYSNCIVESPIKNEKCNGQLVPIKNK